MCLNHPALVHKNPTQLAISVLVFRVGSMRFDVLQQPRTSAKHTLNSVIVWFV